MERSQNQFTSSLPSYVWRQMTNEMAWASNPRPLVARAQGSFYWDTEGRKIIDGNSGLQNLHIGHGRDEIASIAAAQIRELDYFPIYNGSHVLVEKLAHALHARMPAFSRFYFLNSGSEAVEAALKLLREYWLLRDEPGRTIVISRRGSYHGNSLWALAATGSSKRTLRNSFLPFLPEAVHASDPLVRAGESEAQATDRLSAEFRALVEACDPARILGVVAEPVQLSGALVPPQGYWQKIRQICSEFGIPLVADEIITGFGRTGRWFGHEHWGIVPDIVVLGKGIASGYAPISAVGVNAAICEVFDAASDRVFHHISTTAGHPLCCGIALENIRILESEYLVARAERSGKRLRELLQKSFGKKPYVTAIRGIGLLNSVVFDTSVVAQGAVPNAALRSACFERGAYIRVDGQMFFIPPLTTDDGTLEELVAIAAESADRWVSQFRK